MIGHYRTVSSFVLTCSVGVSLNRNHIRKSKRVKARNGFYNSVGAIHRKRITTMKNRKVIENIQPFNDVYISCYYSSLFPVINKFGKNILPFLLNNFVHIKYDKDMKKIIAADDKIVSEEKLFSEQGLLIKKDAIGNDTALDDIRFSIKNNSPVIVLIDSYFQRISCNTYLKKHSLHYLLIFGFDDQKQILRINEHAFWESKKYDLFDWEYQEFLDAYNGAKLYQKNEEFSNLQIELKGSKRVENLFALERFLAYIQQNCDCIFQELNLLRDNISSLFYDYNNLQYVLDKYRKSKKAILYVLQRTENKSKKELEEALIVLEKLWGLITKALITKQISARLSNKIEEVSFEFLEKDLVFYENLLYK